MERFAKAVLRAVILIGLTSRHCPAQDFNQERSYSDLRKIVALGPRPAGSPAAESCRAYIRSVANGMGLEVEEQRFRARTPLGEVQMANLRVFLPGARKDKIVFAGHYDTKWFFAFDFVGANDGGSSTAFLLELMRTLKNRRHKLSYELLFLDGEEAILDWKGADHTYGSQWYVDEARRNGTARQIKAMILVDMIGDASLDIRRDPNSTAWLTDLIWASAKHLGHGREFLDQPLAVEDDHIPFIQADIPAVDIIDLDYPAWHTPQDTLDKLSPASLGIVGRVLLQALPSIEAKTLKSK